MKAPVGPRAAAARPAATDGLLMAVGTLTALRVPAPGRVDADVARWAMLLAAAPGLLLGLLAAAVVGTGSWVGLPALVVAVAAVAAVALATRGLHLDGLADTADALACGYDRQRALEVMRRGDTGPAGTVALVLVLGAQVSALAAVVAGTGAGTGACAAAVASVVSRGVLPLACVRGVPPARPSGLGAAVAGTVPRGAAVAVAITTLATVVGLGVLGGVGAVRAAVAALVAWLAGAAVLARCTRRLGGVTGDVLGAVVETASAAALVVLAAGWSTS